MRLESSSRPGCYYGQFEFIIFTRDYNVKRIYCRLFEYNSTELLPSVIVPVSAGAGSLAGGEFRNVSGKLS